MHSNGKNIMELQGTTAGILLTIVYSLKIEPGGHRTVPLECNSQLEDQMDIRVDAVHDPSSHNCAVFMLYTCIISHNTKLHIQGVAPRAQYTDPMSEAVVLQ